MTLHKAPKLGIYQVSSKDCNQKYVGQATRIISCDESVTKVLVYKTNYVLV